MRFITYSANMAGEAITEPKHHVSMLEALRHLEHEAKHLHVTELNAEKSAKWARVIEDITHAQHRVKTADHDIGGYGISVPMNEIWRAEPEEDII